MAASTAIAEVIAADAAVGCAAIAPSEASAQMSRPCSLNAAPHSQAFHRELY